MYRGFFSGNIFAKIEFVALTIFFLWLIYKNANKIKVFYASKFNKVIKVLILVFTIILDALTYLILRVYNVNWLIAVAINAIFMTLIVMLSLSVYFLGDKK